ncbi:hypothetical protein VIN7_6936 [Saccharomyces cerevisiae x Saccharomyces kudriavzevii VIN7]|uniref:Uncharacterized protein n=1 Tax=Saccharomyces cerevisiae x Saccharomyces kudriavzevii (strain VIN7) TaxID=1095631 RepID=H0GUE8_SACCK|nr:hypothetical protein VIN7_6936 [Saccharomyces cerevisiae x Saccharomyces kudriavzevii VIN7]
MCAVQDDVPAVNGRIEKISFFGWLMVSIKRIFLANIPPPPSRFFLIVFSSAEQNIKYTTYHYIRGFQNPHVDSTCGGISMGWHNRQYRRNIYVQLILAEEDIKFFNGRVLMKIDFPISLQVFLLAPDSLAFLLILILELILQRILESIVYKMVNLQRITESC